MSKTFVFSTSKPPETAYAQSTAVAFAMRDAIDSGTCAVAWQLAKDSWAHAAITEEQSAAIDKSDLVESYRILKYIPELMAPKEFHVYVLRAVEVRLVQASPEGKK